MGNGVSQFVFHLVYTSPISLQANYTVDESQSDSVKILFILKGILFQNAEHFCHSHIHSTEYITDNDSQSPSKTWWPTTKSRYDTNTDLVFEIDLLDHDSSVTVSLQIPIGAVLHVIGYIMDLIFVLISFFIYLFLSTKHVVYIRFQL